MKDFLKDFLGVAVAYFGSALIGFLFNLLFGWMICSWAHWVIVVFSIFFTTILFGIGSMFGSIVASLFRFRSIFMAILSSAAVIYGAYTSIRNLWQIPVINNIHDGGWTTYICVYGTIFFAIIFLILTIIPFSSWLQKENN